jgi:hypothetical protein
MTAEEAIMKLEGAGYRLLLRPDGMIKPLFPAQYSRPVFADECFAAIKASKPEAVAYLAIRARGGRSVRAADGGDMYRDTLGGSSSEVIRALDRWAVAMREGIINVIKIYVDTEVTRACIHYQTYTPREWLDKLIDSAAVEAFTRDYSRLLDLQSEEFADASALEAETLGANEFDRRQEARRREHSELLRIVEMERNAIEVGACGESA